MAEQLSTQGDRQLRWLEEGDCFITYMKANREFPDALWDRWVEAMLATSCSTCVLATGGDIKSTNAQWKRATRAMKKSKKSFAVVSDSRQVAAQTKAASWLDIRIKAFRWDNLYDAGQFLDHGQELRMAVRRILTELNGGEGAGPSRPSSSPSFPDALSSRPRPTARPASAPPRSFERKSTSNPSEPSKTPMTDAASANLERTRRTSEEIQAKLAAIQARLRASRLKK